MAWLNLFFRKGDRMTNPLPNYLHIQRQVERCPGAIVTEKIEKIGGDCMSEEIEYWRGDQWEVNGDKLRGDRMSEGIDLS
jgi:hypothetical protein